MRVRNKTTIYDEIGINGNPVLVPEGENIHSEISSGRCREEFFDLLFQLVDIK